MLPASRTFAESWRGHRFASSEWALDQGAPRCFKPTGTRPPLVSWGRYEARSRCEVRQLLCHVNRDVLCRLGAGVFHPMLSDVLAFGDAIARTQRAVSFTGPVRKQRPIRDMHERRAILMTVNSNDTAGLEGDEAHAQPPSLRRGDLCRQVNCAKLGRVLPLALLQGL